MWVLGGEERARVRMPAAQLCSANTGKGTHQDTAGAHGDSPEPGQRNNDKGENSCVEEHRCVVACGGRSKYHRIILEVEVKAVLQLLVEHCLLASRHGHKIFLRFQQDDSREKSLHKAYGVAT